MAKVIMIRNTYGGAGYLANALDYVRDERNQYGGGYGVDPYSPTVAYEQMMYTKRYFNKTSGNPLVHIIVGYTKNVTSMNAAAVYGNSIARMFADRYQVLYCTHQYDDEYYNWYHTHLIVNSVSYVNGAMMETGYREMNQFCKQLSGLLNEPCTFIFKNKSEM